VAIPIAAQLRRFRWAATLTAIVLLECVVLAGNHFRCPLTNLAARYTSERAANFDVYLPLWFAAHNQSIFGTLFLAGALFALYRCLSSRAQRRWPGNQVSVRNRRKSFPPSPEPSLEPHP
jgi:hypothetical protein